MNEHIERLVGKVRREVAVEQMEARRLRAMRDYDAGAAEVWAALTEPERIGDWLAPVSGELRKGGRFRLEGAASGMIEACHIGRRIEASWDNAGETGRISIELASGPDGGTTLTLHHVALAEPERWRKFGPGVIGVGWDMALLGLARHLGAREAAMLTQDAQEWMFSDEGRTFVRQSASAWGEAAAAAGQDRLQALEAAARAAQVYAGEGSDAG